MSKPSYVVGDVVLVAKRSGVNAAGAVGVVVEQYRLANRDGWTILFRDGRYDGFSPDDCDLFGVCKFAHAQSIADYQFKNAVRLAYDFEASRFAEAFDYVGYRVDNFVAVEVGKPVDVGWGTIVLNANETVTRTCNGCRAIAVSRVLPNGEVARVPFVHDDDCPIFARLGNNAEVS